MNNGNVVCPGPPACRRRHARGERNGRARFTDAQVAAIRAAAARGERQADLARQYRASEATISFYVRRLRRQQSGPMP